MSRIGKLPIKIPDNVEVTIKDGSVFVKGPKGELNQPIHPSMSVTKEDDTLLIRPAALIKGDKLEGKISAIWGLTRALIFNTIKGVSEGYEKQLEMEGVGYKVQSAGNKLIFSLGFSHPVEFAIPEGIKISVEGNVIRVNGQDKQLVGQVAAKIRALKKPEPYKGKGIKYKGEHIRRKVGKKAATA